MADPRPSKQKRRGGAWEQVEKFHDPGSGIGIVISKRIRGRPEYSFAFVQFDEAGTDKFLTFPVRGDHALKDILYSLGQRAEERLQALTALDKANHQKEKERAS